MTYRLLLPSGSLSKTKPRPCRLPLSLLAAALVLGLTTSVFAESSEPAPPAPCQTHVAPHQQGDVSALTLLGVACFEAGNFPQALNFYLQALAISDPIMLRGAIGRALHELGIYSAAKFYYEDFLRHAGEVEGAQRIQERLREVEEQIAEESGSFTLRPIPANATVYLILSDGNWFELGQGPTRATLKNGKYELLVHHPDYYPRRVRANLREGRDHQELEVELVPGGAAFDISSRQWRRLGGMTMGAATPFALGGVTLLVLGNQTEKTALSYDPETTGHSLEDRRAMHDKADRLQFWGIASAGVGVSGLLLGAIFYASGHRDSSPDPEPMEPEAGIRITPAFGFGNIGVTVNW